MLQLVLVTWGSAGAASGFVVQVKVEEHHQMIPQGLHHLSAVRRDILPVELNDFFALRKGSSD